MKDPVVKNIDEWINRSAGQHKRYASEGHESAKRILGDLHRVDTGQLGQRDGVSVGACRTDLPIEYAGPEPRDEEEMSPLMTVLLYVVCAVVLLAALAATAPELVLMLMGLI